MHDDTAQVLAHIEEDIRRKRLTNQQVLEEFVVYNPELERLESILDEFNIFEAIGVVRQELRHSDFLAFLLDPAGNHGLDDRFLKRLLQKVLLAGTEQTLPISLIDLDVWHLEGTQVKREVDNIDILLMNEANHLAVIIENKVDTGEHSDQLARYYQSVSQQYPDWRIIALYLTPSGENPSDPRFLSVSYRVIVDLVEKLVEDRASTLGVDVRTLMQHYAKMLRRHIVSDSEIDDLCLRIYQRHQRALDLIFERRPDRLAHLSEEIEKLVRSTPNIHVRWRTRGEIAFHPVQWDTPVLQGPNGESAARLVIQFYLSINPRRVKILCWLCPGPVGLRQKLLDLALDHKPPFKPRSGVLKKGWNSLYSRGLLSEPQMQSLETGLPNQEVAKQWDVFMKTDLPAIQEVLRQQDWIWSDTFDYWADAPTGEEEASPEGDDAEE
jgi:hypothetical protein